MEDNTSGEDTVKPYIGKSTGPEYSTNPNVDLNPVNSMTSDQAGYSMNSVPSMTPLSTHHSGFPTGESMSLHLPSGDRDTAEPTLNSKVHSAERFDAQGHFQTHHHGNRWQSQGQTEHCQGQNKSSDGHFKHDFVQEHFDNPAMPNPWGNRNQSVSHSDSIGRTWAPTSTTEIQGELYKFGSDGRHDTSQNKSVQKHSNVGGSYLNRNKKFISFSQPEKHRDVSQAQSHQQQPFNRESDMNRAARYQTMTSDRSGLNAERDNFHHQQNKRMVGNIFSSQNSCESVTEPAHQPIKKIKLASKFLKK